MENFKLMLIAIVAAIMMFSHVRSTRSNIVTQKSSPSQDSPSGKTIYQSKCLKCHNADPSKKGSIGPDIADASLELVTVRTQKRGYPAGYTPKRKTKIMPVVKLTEKEIKAVHEYISSFNKGK
jgi:mono/diheme cytochrome c family protein